MRATPASSLILSFLLTLATLLLPLSLVHAQRQQQKEHPSAPDITTSDDTANNHHELGIEFRHRPRLYRAIDYFYASVAENNIQNKNRNWRQKRRIYRRDLLSDVLKSVVPTPSNDGSGSNEGMFSFLPYVLFTCFCIRTLLQTFLLSSFPFHLFLSLSALPFPSLQSWMHATFFVFIYARFFAIQKGPDWVSGLPSICFCSSFEWCLPPSHIISHFFHPCPST